MNTKFSVAIHALILISESKEKMSSEDIAKSVGCRSSYIRKVLSLLRRTGLISSSQGISGFTLERNPNEITLYDIYSSINTKPFFDIHQNSNDKCIVGRHIKPTLNTLLVEMEESIKKELSNKTLNDYIEIMRNNLSEEELLSL